MPLLVSTIFVYANTQAMQHKVSWVVNKTDISSLLSSLLGCFLKNTASRLNL